MEKKRARELSDQDLEQATGGMRPMAAYFKCPKCRFGNDKKILCTLLTQVERLAASIVDMKMMNLSLNM